MKLEFPACRARLPHGLTTLAIYLYILGVSTPAVVASENASREVQPITKSLENNPETKLFTSGLKKSGLWDEIAGSGELTLFVPKDKVLRKEGSAFLLEVVLIKPENENRLHELIAQHVFPEVTLTDDQLNTPLLLTNFYGGCVSIEAKLEHSPGVGPEAVVTGSETFANGRVYYIDRLLWQHFESDEKCIRLTGID